MAATARMTVWLAMAFMSISATLTTAAYQNVTTLLAPHKQYSTFNSLLVRSGVATQVNSRTTITVLCPPNVQLDAFMSSNGNTMDRQTLFNILSYHVLLDYEDQTRLRSIAPGAGIITTLFQTTGLAAGMNGLMNITAGGGGGALAQIHLPGSSAVAANITAVIDLYPYNISLLAIDAVLQPAGSAVPVGGPVNITQIISQSGNFSLFVSLLTLTGVDRIFQSHDNPPGITILVPTNKAIESLQKTLTTLPNAQIISLLQYHAIASYYPAQELIAAATPQPTMASGNNPLSYTLYTTGSEHGAVTVHAGRNTATVIASLFSNNPLSIFAIDAVLQPAEIFTFAAAPTLSTPFTAPAPHNLVAAPMSSPTTSPAPIFAAPIVSVQPRSPSPAPVFAAPVVTAPQSPSPAPVFAAPVVTVPQPPSPAPMFAAPVETVPRSPSPAPVFAAPVVTAPQSPSSAPVFEAPVVKTPSPAPMFAAPVVTTPRTPSPAPSVEAPTTSEPMLATLSPSPFMFASSPDNDSIFSFAPASCANPLNVLFSVFFVVLGVVFSAN